MEDTCFYQSIVEHTPVGYSYNKIIYNEDGETKDYEFLKVNNTYELMLGIKGKDWLGRKVSELYELLNNEPIDWFGFHQDILERSQEKQFEESYSYLDRHYRIKIYSPQEGYVIMSLTDVSKELAETEKLKTLYNSVPIQVWYLKDAYTYLASNKVHADFIGVKSEELTEKKLRNYLVQKKRLFALLEMS